MTYGNPGTTWTVQLVWLGTTHMVGEVRVH
jgi:hypothetical protein